MALKGLTEGCTLYGTPCSLTLEGADCSHVFNKLTCSRQEYVARVEFWLGNDDERSRNPGA